ncbi:MAG: MFS transporter [Candidatus Dormibacteria bacterium]
MLDLLTDLIRGRLDTAGRLLLGQLVMFTGIAALFPIVPLYVAHRGGGAVTIALFVAGPLVGNMVAQVPSGHLVDRIGRKPVLIGSRLAYAAIALLLFADRGPLWLLATLRCAQGLTSGAYVPALRAALADLTPADRRGERFAQLQAVEMLGLLVGPAIGGAVALWRDNGVFLFAGLAVLLGVVSLLRMPETRVTGVVGAESTGTAGWWRSQPLIVAALSLGALGVMFSLYDVIWPQYIARRGYGPLVIGLSISFFAVPILLLATTAGRLSDRGHRRELVTAGLLVIGGCAATYPWLRSLPIILTVGGVEAVAVVVLEPSLFAVIADSSAADVRGRAMGLGGFFEFAGSAFGAGAIGSLYGVSEPLAFLGGAACCVLAAGLSWAGLPRGGTGPAVRGAPVSAGLELEARA